MLQKLILIGNLGQEPTMRYTPNGTPVTSFPVATNRKWTDAQGQAKEEVTWFRVSAWGKLAEVANQYLGKGRRVYVEGILVCDDKTGGPRVYQRKDGTAGASFEVRAASIKFLDRAPDVASGSSGAPDRDGAGNEIMTEEELPF